MRKHEDTSEQDLQELQAQLCPLQHQDVTWAVRAGPEQQLTCQLKRGCEIVDLS